MDDHSSLNLHLDSNTNSLDFSDMNSSIGKADPDDMSLDKINATYQPYETEPYLEELLKKKPKKNNDLQIFTDTAPSIPLSMPEIALDIEDINLDETVHKNNMIPNEISGSNDVCSKMEPQSKSTNEHEVYKEFLTFKTPRRPDFSKKLSNKNIQDSKLPNKSVQSNKNLPSKINLANKYFPNKSINANSILVNKSIPSNKLGGIQASNLLPKISIQGINKMPTKSIQINNKMLNKEKIKDLHFKLQKDMQNQNVIQDFVHITDRIVPPRAIAVLPPSLQLRDDIVSPVRLLPPRLRFGPIQGIKRVITKSDLRDIVADSAAMKKPVFFLGGNNGETILIDTADKDKANWLCLLPVGTYDTANIWLYEDNNELYGFTTKYISAKKPLTLGYSKAYADKYKLPTFQPILNLTAFASAAKKWVCEECNRTFTSAALLQRHLDFYHKNEKPQPWRRYSCRHCSTSFGRFYTLKRHMEYCDKSEYIPETFNKPKEKPVNKPRDDTLNKRKAELINKPIEELKIKIPVEKSKITIALDKPQITNQITMPIVKPQITIPVEMPQITIPKVEPLITTPIDMPKISIQKLEPQIAIPVEMPQITLSKEEQQITMPIQKPQFTIPVDMSQKTILTKELQITIPPEMSQITLPVEEPEIIPIEEHITMSMDDSQIPTPVMREIEENEVPEIPISEIDDNSLPLDECFHNFDGLDLSEDLFDDNISEFNMSNGSRPESELRHYDIREKDENSLLNDEEFMEFSENLISNDLNAINRSKRKVVVSCVYCKQNVLVRERRQHLFKCIVRRKECKCGRVFINKRKFIQHIFKQHKVEVEIKKEQKPEKVSPEFKKYECEYCQITFKRRGMLVNHLWRVHSVKTAVVPLEKRVKHYLCVACPKIYRTAAKRNRHVRLHHPGQEKIRAICIDGGMVTCKPAACNACPRQYATRAKLLQHVRMQHPHLAPPSKKRSKTNLRIAS